MEGILSLTHSTILVFGRDIVNIILARGRLQQIKHIGTGGSAMNPSRGNPTQGKLTARLL